MKARDRAADLIPGQVLVDAGELARLRAVDLVASALASPIDRKDLEELLRLDANHPDPRERREARAQLLEMAPRLARALLALASRPEWGAVVRSHREALGRIVRAAWVAWAQEQVNPKPSWLVPWEGLAEHDREADRRIGEAVALAVGDGSALSEPGGAK